MENNSTVRPPDFLAHHDGDVVAVAVHDLSPGLAEGGYLHGPASVSVDLSDPVPLGHKLALVDVPEGGAITEYGVRVAIATRDIKAGQHVHVHNVRSARWQSSVA